MTMGGKRIGRSTMRLLMLFIVAFAPSIWFNDFFVVMLEFVLEDDRPVEVCVAPVAVPADQIGCDSPFAE